MYALNDYICYFDSFGVEHIPKEIKHFIGNKNMEANVFSIQAYHLVIFFVWIFCVLDLLILCLKIKA